MCIFLGIIILQVKSLRSILATHIKIKNNKILKEFGLCLEFYFKS